jgi:hypothetical protein
VQLEAKEVATPGGHPTLAARRNPAKTFLKGVYHSLQLELRLIDKPFKGAQTSLILHESLCTTFKGDLYKVR